MARNRELINYALKYVGGELLTDIWYWSSTENSTYYAWGVNFSNGYINSSFECNGIAVRAVAAF